MQRERGGRRRWHCLRAVLVTVSVIALACWSRQVHTLPTLRPRLQYRLPRLRPAADVSDAQFSTLAAVVRQGGMANLSTALGSADLFVTFGSSSLLPFVLNWVGTLRHHGVWRLMVGALDEEMRAACEASGVPSLHIGAAHQGRGAGGYFRKDYEAFKRMGTAKVRTMPMHIPCTPHAHTMHTPCTHHAHPMHTPCTHYARAMGRLGALSPYMCRACTMHILCRFLGAHTHGHGHACAIQGALPKRAARRRASW